MIDPLILVRFIHIAATELASGTVCFVALVADVPALRRRMNLTVWIALAVAVLSGAAWLVLLTMDILGGSIAEVCLHGGVWQVVGDTRFGMVWCVRLVLALVVGFLMLWPGARWLQAIAGAGLIALLGLISHAGATPGLAGELHLASDMVHLVAASAWLGALPAFAILLVQARDKRALRALTPAATQRFSWLGIVCVGALLASGVINSWNLLGHVRDLIATDYGRLVSLKIALFLAMIGVATVNKYHLTPQLPAPGALRALQRNSQIEIVLGLFVLLSVGALGTMVPTAHVHAPLVAIPQDAAFIHIHDADAMADVTIEPGHAGRAKVTVHVMREDSSELAVDSVSVMLHPPKDGGNPVVRLAKRMADANWQTDDLDLAQPGIWTVQVTVMPESGKSVVLDAPIVIDP